MHMHIYAVLVQCARTVRMCTSHACACACTCTHAACHCANLELLVTAASPTSSHRAVLRGVGWGTHARH